MSTEIVPAVSVETAIDEANQLRQALVGYAGRAHILSPFARTDYAVIAPGHRASLIKVTISGNPEDKEVYSLMENPGQFALKEVALQRLDRLAGLRWVRSKIVIDKDDPLFVTAEAEAVIRDMDGSLNNRIANRPVDLRDGSPEAQEMVDRWKRKNLKKGDVIPENFVPPELARARRYISQLAESKAQNRVRRKILGLQSSFTQKELELPFIVVRLVPIIDMSDPLVRQLIVMQQLGISSELYGRAVAALEEKQSAQRLVVAPPTDAKGLEIDEPYNSETAASEDKIDSAEVKAETERQELIARAEAIYKSKGIRRDSRKPPLSALNSKQLQEVIEHYEPSGDTAPA